MRWLGWMLFVACRGPAELVDSCTGDDCLPCETDGDCVIAHNPCSETAVCGHVDEELAVVQLGCDAALEYETPPADACTCQRTCGVGRATD